MEKRISRVLISLLVVFMMTVTAIQPIMSLNNEESNSVMDQLASPITNNMDDVNNLPAHGEIAHESFSKVNLYKDIVIATTDVAELADYLAGYDFNGIIGTGSSNRQGIAFPVISVPPEAITGIASLPGVMGVYDYVDPVSNSNIDGTEFSRDLLGLGPNSPVLNSPYGDINAATLYHGAEDAWANGFTGDGVQIATVTSGTDFGNAELRGRQAIVDSDIVISSEVLVEPVNANTTNAQLGMSEYYSVVNCDIYVDDVQLSSGYTLSDDGYITFDPVIGPNKWINASYSYHSPYYNYPIAFDPASMSMYISEGGVQSTTVSPGDSWYVNTSSSDLHIYHTILVDGTNDFWTEQNIHGSSESVYPLSRTSELRADDPAKDMAGLELDLKSLYSAADNDNWYFGFDVTPEVRTDSFTWTRAFDVNYGLYIDTDNVSGSGASIDPEGNYINTTTNHLPEYAVYFHHTGSDWGIKGTMTKYTVDTLGEWSNGTLTNVDWGVNRNGKWENNVSIAVDTVSDSQVVSDLTSWSNNDTMQNATLYSWNGAAWNAFTITQESPYNATNNIGIGADSQIVKFQGNGTRFLYHLGHYYKIYSNNTINLTATDYSDDSWDGVKLEYLKGEQAYSGSFVEFSLPKDMLEGVDSFSEMLFSVGDNASHAQDTVPSDPAVAFEEPDWNANNTQLSSLLTVYPVPEYIVSGIPSASGEYRIGLHPDKNLMNQHYGRPVAVLATDYYDAGVYDAVYVDLDNDKDFTDEIPAMEFGAYNDSKMIGPRYGTTRDDEAGTITHNSTVYPVMNQVVDIQSYNVTNETLILGAAGGETNFALANQNISVAPTLQRNTSQTLAIINETSYITTAGDVGNEVTFYTANAPLLDINLYVFIPSDATYPLGAGSDYTVNMATGEINTLLGGVDQDWEFYTYYNYSNPLTINPTYTLDALNGTLVLDQALTAGDDLVALNYSYEITNITDVQPYINYPGATDICYIEMRDWVSNRDIDADGGTGDGEPYPDLSGGMVYFIGRESSVTGEALTVTDGKSTLQHRQVTEDSEVVYLDGTALPNNNYTIDWKSGKITFDLTITGSITIDYAYNRIPIPYSDIYWEWNSVDDEKRISPGNGDMVCFFGEFDESSARGTEVGSTICGQGKVVDGNGNELVKGMAPDAKLVSIRGGAFGSWFFATEGYDGIVGTDDDSQIVAVTSNFPVSTAGWDVYTKGAEYIGSHYSQGRTVFVAATGDSGFGYGTTASPGSSDATITAGQGTQFDYRRYDPGAPEELSRLYGDKGPSPQHGDILPSSGRGPNMLGNPEPDVITAGAFLFGATPLNIDQDTFTPTAFDWYGGQWAWDLWSGSALSASSTAGMLALIYDAYEDVNGGYPNIQEARSLLRSGADNMNYDTLSQGAGYCNVDRSTKLAAEMDGLYLDKTYWVPGDYRGVRYEGFVKLMEPGESATQTISIENKNQTNSTDVQIYDAIFHKFGSYDIPINITKTYDDADTPAIINIEPYIDVGTELLKVTATSARKATMQTYMAEFFDWTDVNGNGELEFPEEKNRVAYCIGSNSLELRYRDPLGRMDDGLAVQIKGFGGTGEALNDWTLHLEFFEKVDWNWLTESGVPSTIAAGSTDNFNLNLNIPSDAGVGSYEGSVYITQKAPEELIATGVGEMKENVTFKLWFHPVFGATGKINDNETTGGMRAIVPKSTVIHWNGTTLYEGVDYDLSGTGGDVKFKKQYPAMNEIPPYAPYFNMTYLTVLADNGNPLENATWEGQVSIPNFVHGNVTLRKDNITWGETEIITDENVTWANGGELTSSISHKNIVRETTELSKNGLIWPQDGGLQSETPIASAFDGQDYAQLNHGNVVPGTAEIYVSTGGGSPELLPQSDEVTILGKEEVVGLNSTSTAVTNEALTVGGAQNTSGNIWYDSFKDAWYGRLNINSIDTPDFTIISYIVHKDGIALTDGLDFNMHINDYGPAIHGQFKLNHDPTGHTYTLDYEYYNHTITVGHLSHGQIVSESYKIYRNGGAMKVTEYSLDLETGIVTMADPLGPNEVIEAAYMFNLYKIDVRTGNITLTDPLTAGDSVDVTYRYFNWTLDLPTGVLEFADSLITGDRINASYMYANYTLDMMNGIVKFSNALMPGVNVTCEYYHYSGVIPVFFNIGADKPDFTVGGPDSNTTLVGDYDELFKYNEIRGGYGSGGDWQYIYMDINEQGRYANPIENERLLVDVTWEEEQTDVDVQVYGGREPLPGVYTGWPYDPLPANEFGPHTVRHVGGSDVTSDFFTTTGGPEEIIAPPISGGLNVIGLHTVGMNGSAKNTEVFSARIGTMYVDPTKVDIVTNQYVGDTQLRMMSNMEWKGVGGIAAGPSAPESLKDLPVTQDDPDWSNYDTFEDQLASGSNVYERTIKDCLIFDVHIWGQDSAPDLDLGVFLDGSGDGEKLDGKVQSDEFVALCADGDADEEVKLIAPADGTYLIVVFGFTLKTNPGFFDMDVTIVQGTGFDLQGKGDNNLPEDQKGYFSSSQIEKTFNQTYLNLGWDLQGSATGTLQGALYVGPGNGPMCMLIPIELTIDTDEPNITVTNPPEGAYLNEQKPEIVVSISDFERGELVPSSLKFSLDDKDVSMQSAVSIPYDDDYEGYFAGTAAYRPTSPLIDGAHAVKVSIEDKAGNTAIKEWSFTVDSSMPSVEITYPAETVSYTNENSITITGTAETGLNLEIIGTSGANLIMGNDGSFSSNIELADGENIFAIRATDLAGNTMDIKRTVYVDSEMPEMNSVKFSNGYLTNEPMTTITGTISEMGVLSINGIDVDINSDGTFSHIFQLIEGVNTIHLEFADMAGNVQHDWYNVTLDTVAPVISLTSGKTVVDTDVYVLSGSVEAGTDIFVNGKRTTVGTRQSGEFSATLTLSPGINKIIVEAEDEAGNTAQYTQTVNYDPNAGVTSVNWGAIGLMITLLVVGLVLGLFLGSMLGGGERQEEPPVDEVLPEAEDAETYEEVPEDMPIDEEVPEDTEMEDISEEEISEDAGDAPIDEDMPEELPEDADAEEIEELADAEPIPVEEGIPEELPEEEPVDISGEITEEVPAPEVAPESDAIEDEDPRIAKLREAFESGKISEELYKKNLERFQNQ